MEVRSSVEILINMWQLTWRHIPVLTYLLTPWCRVLLAKLIGLQLVNKFPAFHGTRRFITAIKRPPPVSILGQPKPVHIPTSHLLEFHPNIIHPSTPRSPQWSPSFRFPHQDPIRPLSSTHTRHMPSPSHSSYTSRLKNYNVYVTVNNTQILPQDNFCLLSENNLGFYVLTRVCLFVFLCWQLKRIYCFSHTLHGPQAQT